MDKNGIPTVDNDKYDIVLNSVGDFNRSIVIIKDAQFTDNWEYTPVVCHLNLREWNWVDVNMGELNRFIVEC